MSDLEANPRAGDSTPKLNRRVVLSAAGPSAKCAVPRRKQGPIGSMKGKSAVAGFLHGGSGGRCGEHGVGVAAGLVRRHPAYRRRRQGECVGASGSDRYRSGQRVRYDHQARFAAAQTAQQVFLHALEGAVAGKRMPCGREQRRQGDDRQGSECGGAHSQSVDVAR